MTAGQRTLRGKVRDGTVVSEKMRKTVIVAIEANFRHRLYKKTVRRVRRLMAHDEREEAHLGDRVRIVESSPISRHKRWRLLEVLTHAELPEVAPESIDLELLGEVKLEEPEAPPAEAAGTEPAEEAAAAPEPRPSPEAESLVPDEAEVAEEVPEVELAVEEAPEPAEGEAEPEPREEAEDTVEEAAGEPETEDEEKPS